MQIKKTVRQLLIRQLDKRYERQLSCRKISYADWISKTEKKKSVLSCSGEQEIVLFYYAKGRMSSACISEISSYFAANPEMLILYGDEDVQTADGERKCPWYKPCWSPDLYLDCFYLGSVMAVRKTLVEQIAPELLQGKPAGTLFIPFEHPEEIRRTADSLIMAAGGFEKGCRSIGRVPSVLFHVNEDRDREAFLPGVSGEEEGQEFLPNVKGDEGPNSPEIVGELVSVIIPSKDNPEVLKKCLGSLKTYVNQKKAEIIIVDNGSTPENRVQVEEMAQGMIYLYHPMEFNFSAMCNLGAAQAKGRFLLFLNDDMEMCKDGWMEAMMQKAAQPYVGAVGLKLYYPDSIRIQHDGITNLPVGPVHKLQFFEDNRSYYFGRNRYNQNCLAVTGACLMLEKEKFREAGGFRESLRVAYNDVDLGFALYETGYQNVVLNTHYAYHHESLSRGSDETWEKQKRLEDEREQLYRLHPVLHGEDPYYPAQLNREGLDSRIVPGYITVYNTVQKPAWQRVPFDIGQIREDQCVMARVETSGPDKMQGYGVVLGDDNACYEKYLMLQPEDMEGVSWYMKLEGQYRQDLEENLPDQKNVALSGFCVNRDGECLKPGNYRIGVMARNRINRLTLLGWSGKNVKISSGVSEV